MRSNRLRLLEACAVLGESFTFSQLLAIIGDERDSGMARTVYLVGWRRLQRDGVLGVVDPTRPDRFSFSVAGERDRILSEIDAPERDRLEQRIAESTLGREG